MLIKALRLCDMVKTGMRETRVALCAGLTAKPNNQRVGGDLGQTNPAALVGWAGLAHSRAAFLYSLLVNGYQCGLLLP